MKFMTAIACCTTFMVQSEFRIFADSDPSNDWDSATIILVPSQVTVVASGTSGNLAWKLDSEGTLKISGTGEMAAVWDDYKEMITEVIIEEGATTIAHGAFADCTVLDTVTLPNSVISIGAEAFAGCTSLTTVSVPDSVTRIGTNAFENCTTLTSVAIGAGVNAIDSNILLNCTSLKEIQVAESNLYYKDIDGVLFTKDATELLIYPDGKQGEYSIPNGVISISTSSFTNCDGLIEIEFSDTVTNIGILAFSGCDSLSSILLPKNVGIIDVYAFDGCTSLSEIMIENPQCDIYDNQVTISDTAIIYGCPGSTAQTYAEKYGRTFIDLSEQPTETITDEFYIYLDILGSKPYETVADIQSIENSNPAVAIIVVSEDKRYFCITGVTDGYAEVTVRLTNGDIYKVYATVGSGESFETTSTEFVAADTTTTTTTSTTTTTATETESETTTTTRDPAFRMGMDNWGFSNVGTYFTRYNEMTQRDVYYLTEEHTARLLDGISNTDRDCIMNKMQQQSSNGSCYGLSVLALYNCYGIIQPSDLQEEANFLRDIAEIPLTNELKSTINYHSLLQYTTPVYSQINALFFSTVTNKEKVNMLLEMEKLSNNEPILLCYGNYAPYITKAHAVVAYGESDGLYSWQINGENIGFNKKVLIYDSNEGDFADENCMYINTSTGRWYIPAHNIDSEQYGQLLLAEDDLDVLQYHSLFGSSDPTVVRYHPMLETETLESNYEVEKVSKDGDGWSINAASSGEIISYAGFMQGSLTCSQRFTMLDGKGNYRLSFTNKFQDINLQMQYENCLMRVNATQTDNIIFQPDGLELTADSSDYNFHMVRNAVPTETSFHTIDVSGDSANRLTFSYEEGEWFLSGDCLQNVRVQANHSTATSNTLTFSIPAKYDTVCLRQMDESTIAVFVDMNSDGEYETSVDEIPADEISLGDVNQDNVVDSLDAANILIAAALVGADMDSGLSDAQKIAADTNKNGTFGAEDAALVLQYAAAVGSGYTGGFEDFLAA
ncbi:MAG: leucine-rich repeat protein [Oscillospiraceae bacterium]|nr:leucine-rich repeat protein [Oscillospiraceae bacterium]